MDTKENVTADFTKRFKNYVSDDAIELLEKSTYVVCLCGSTRFKELFMQLNRLFTKQEWVVLMPGVWGHAGDKISKSEKEKLDQLHRKKIMMSDCVYVINPDGYIGESTKKEIEFAKSLGKMIRYFDEEKTND